MEEILNSEIFLVVMAGLIITLAIISIILVFKGKKDVAIFTEEEIEQDEIKPAIEKNEIDKMLEVMESDMENKEEDEIKSFEDQQEEESIISYQELLSKTQEINALKIKEELNKTKEKEKTLELKEEKELETKELEVIADKKENKNERNRDVFISPIYGKQEGVMSYPTVPKIKRETENTAFEETFKVESLPKDVQKNEEFLEMLKEFRNNLE